jgi:hypothetical protein
MKKFDVDIDSPRVRELVTENAAVFTQAMNAMVGASQLPTATEEENVALLLRGTVAYAAGICKTFNVKPETFADMMHLFEDAKINSRRIRR